MAPALGLNKRKALPLNNPQTVALPRGGSVTVGDDFRKRVGDPQAIVSGMNAGRSPAVSAVKEYADQDYAGTSGQRPTRDGDSASVIDMMGNLTNAEAQQVKSGLMKRRISNRMRGDGVGRANLPEGMSHDQWNGLGMFERAAHRSGKLDEMRGRHDRGTMTLDDALGLGLKRSKYGDFGTKEVDDIELGVGLAGGYRGRGGVAGSHTRTRTVPQSSSEWLAGENDRLAKIYDDQQVAAAGLAQRQAEVLSSKQERESAERVAQITADGKADSGKDRFKTVMQKNADGSESAFTLDTTNGQDVTDYGPSFDPMVMPFKDQQVYLDARKAVNDHQRKMSAGEKKYGFINLKNRQKDLEKQQLTMMNLERLYGRESSDAAAAASPTETPPAEMITANEAAKASGQNTFVYGGQTYQVK